MATEETKPQLRLDPDFRREPQTSRYCVQCQRDIKDANKAVRVTVNWDTWEFVLGGDELLGADCAEKFGLENANDD